MKGSLLLVSLAFSAACVAQQSATIVGSVRDTSGKAVGGAKLTAVEARTGEQRFSESLPDGAFVFPAIPPDTYQITASFGASGGSSTTVTVAAGQSRTVQLEIHTDSATTLIALDTQATTIEMTSSRLGMNVTNAETAGLPVNGRTYAPLLLTAPGIVTAGTATFNDIRGNGQSGAQNDIRLDGVDASSIISASPGLSLIPGFLFRLQASLDSIDEFRVDSALYPATEGHGSGVHVELASRSGSSEWHGSFAEYLRNNRLDARNFFDGAANTSLHMNQFGASVGGALVKSKLFIFGNGEQLFQTAGFNVLEQVPSAFARARAVPLVQRILAGIPLGSPTADPDVDTAVQTGQARDNETTYGVRLDYVASARDHLFARETRATGDYSAPDDTTAPRFTYSTLHSGQFVAKWDRIQSASKINELTIGFNRSESRLAISTTSPAAEGILVNFGDGMVSPGSLFALPASYLGRAATFDGRHYHLGDVFTLVHGAHTIKLGGEAGLIRLPFSAAGGTSYQFLNLDNFLQNADADVTVSPDLQQRSQAQEQVAYFAQDEWRIATTVLLNFGVRYEYYTATREVQNRALLVDPFSLSTRAASGGFYPTSRLGFNPRLGLSWAPRSGNGGTVIRLGAGSYQAPVSLLDSFQPIIAGNSRTFSLDTTIPESGQAVAYINPPVSLSPALDANSFRHIARVYQYGLSIQQAIPGKFIAQAAYSGNLARHLEQWGQSNPIIGLRETGRDLIDLRTNNSFGAVDYLTNGGNSSFNALNLNLTRRLVDNLTLSASYGWSHSIGDSQGAGDAALPQNPACLACERANNDFDIRHVFAANALYDLPFGSHGRYLRSGLAGRLLGGWTMGAVLNLRTGLPVNVTLDRPDEIYFDPSSGLYYSSSAPLPAAAVPQLNIPGGGESRPALRPNLTPGVDPYIRNSNGRWLNPAAFSTPLSGTYGNLGRNTLRGPGFSQFDVQLSRRVRFGERHSLLFRLEAFNLFNHANFANPQANLPDALTDLQPGAAFSTATAPGFGHLISTVGKTVGLGTSRQVQLGVRYEF